MVNPINAPTSDDKLWSGLSYAGVACCLIPTVVIFFLKKDESNFIKFHGLQAIAFGLISIALSILTGVLASIPIIGMVFGLISFFVLPLVLLGAWCILMIFAFQGKDFRIPVIAEFIDQNLMS